MSIQKKKVLRKQRGDRSGGRNDLPPMTPLEKMTVQRNSYIARNIGEWIPEQLFVNLKYPDVGVRTSNGTSSFNWRFRSSAWDVDPLLGSTSIPGFAELASCYNYYRVHGIGYDTTNCNAHSSPLFIGVWPSPTDPGAGLSLQQIIDYAHNPLGESEIVQVTPYGRFKRKRYYSLSEILGSDQWILDDNYTALTTTNPATMVYINLGIAATNGTFTTTSGSHNSTVITLHVEFFGRKIVQA